MRESEKRMLYTMQGHKLRRGDVMLKTLGIISLLIVLLIGVAIGGCRSGKESMSIGTLSWEAEADKAYQLPKSSPITGYRHIYLLFRQGREREASNLLKNLSTARIRLAPDSVFEDERRYYSIYCAGRLGPTVTLLRHVALANREYAIRLIAAGDIAGGLAALQLNLQVARQTIHLEPPSFLAVIEGVSIGRLTWQTAQEVLAKSNDEKSTQVAKTCIGALEHFRAEHLEPAVLQKNREMDQVIKQFGERDTSHALRVERRWLPRIHELIHYWDERVDRPPCGKLPGAT